jgi:hypothetical protein
LFFEQLVYASMLRMWSLCRIPERQQHAFF